MMFLRWLYLIGGLILPWLLLLPLAGQLARFAIDLVPINGWFVDWSAAFAALAPLCLLIAGRGLGRSLFDAAWQLSTLAMCIWIGLQIGFDLLDDLGHAGLRDLLYRLILALLLIVLPLRLAVAQGGPAGLFTRLRAGVTGAGWWQDPLSGRIELIPAEATLTLPTATTAKSNRRAPRPPTSASDLAAVWQRSVIGQDEPVQALARLIVRRFAQEGRRQPVATALFAGPTGVGKTELAKAVAAGLFGTEAALLRIDCGNVLGAPGLQTLIGAPRGYMGSDQPGLLQRHRAEHAAGVLLFDEIEKALSPEAGPGHAPMLRLLLSLIDEGRVTEQSTGETLDFRDHIILLTSNARAEQLGAIATAGLDEERQARAAKDALRGLFPPEFLARLDLVLAFRPLDPAARRRIIALHTHALAERHGLRLATIDPAFLDHIDARWQQLLPYGTREALRLIETSLSDALIASARCFGRTRRLRWVEGAARLNSAAPWQLPKRSGGQ